MTEPSPCQKENEDLSDDNDEILVLPSDSAKTAQDILPIFNEHQMKNIILPLKKSCREDFVPQLDMKSEPVMIFTSEERGFIQKLLQIGGYYSNFKKRISPKILGLVYTKYWLFYYL